MSPLVGQVSNALNQPAIIIQAWPPEQQLAGALQGPDSFNETIQYIQAMPSLFTEASFFSLSWRRFAEGELKMAENRGSRQACAGAKASSGGAAGCEEKNPEPALHPARHAEL